MIAAALVKTDPKDTMTLAKLLAVGMIPAGGVPPQPVRALRALMNHRQRLIAQQTRTKNRLGSLLPRQHIVPRKAICSVRPPIPAGPSST